MRTNPNVIKLRKNIEEQIMLKAYLFFFFNFFEISVDKFIEFCGEALKNEYIFKEVHK